MRKLPAPVANGARKETYEMKIIGINSTKSEDGRINTTLHVADSFPDYYNNPEKGRSCIGQRVDSIYVGDYDPATLRTLRPGMEVEIYYDKAVTSSKGTFQSVKKIEVISKQ